MAAIGSPSVPVYIDENGAAKPCTSITPGGSGGGSTVVGSIVPYGGTDTPDGFLYCDGSEVSKESYADLYAVIGNTFGTATDPLKFKLPKINDARYLQGNTTPGQEKSEELPNIKGSFWGGLHDTNYGYEGCFTMTGANRNGNNTADENNPQVNFDASLSSSIYKDGGAVQPKSVTIRYLICWKKTIAKVDTLISVPDWSSKVKYDLSSAVKSSYAKTYEGQSFTFTRMTTFTVPEPGFINAMSMAQNDSSFSAVEINGKLIEVNSDCNGCDGFESNFVPVDTGDVVTLYSTEYDYLKRWVDYYPAKATPSKLSELYMGSPDWNSSKKVDIPSGVTTTNPWIVPQDGFIRFSMQATPTTTSGDHYIILFVNDVETAYVVGNGSYNPSGVSTVPVSKGDKIAFDISHGASLYNSQFYPRKKVQVDISDIDVTGTGAGAVDGTILTESHPSFGSIITAAKQIFTAYTVQNDCGLYLGYTGNINTENTIRFFIGDKQILALTCNDGDTSSEPLATEGNGTIINVKKGSVIKVACSGIGSTSSTVLDFVEYQLKSANTIVDATAVMPDYMSARVLTFSGGVENTIEEDGFLMCRSNGNGDSDVFIKTKSSVSGGWITVTADGYSDAASDGNLIPVSKGDVWKAAQSTGITVWFIPMKTAPVKLTEMYMGAPDYSATWDNFLTLAGGAKSTGGTYNVEANGFIRVYAGNNNYGASTSSGWSMKINDKTVVENYCSITDVPELNSIVPVSKGDVVTWTAITAGSAGGVTFDFIPRKKIQVDGNDIIATGKGGVIDGSLCKDATEVEFAKASTSSVKENVQYTTDNDCLLVIRTDGTDFAEGNYGANVFVNGAFVGTLLDTFGGSYNKDFPTLAIPVKKGSKITFDRITGTNKNIWVAGTGTIKVTFYEYQLISINPQAAFPDWDTTKKVSLASGDAAPANGYICCVPTQITSIITGNFWFKVNGIQVFVGGREGGNWHDNQMNVVPVAKGDIVTFSTTEGVYSLAADFYPAKAMQQENSSKTYVDFGGGAEITSKADKLSYVTTTSDYAIYTATKNCKFHIHTLIDDISTSGGVYRYLKLLVNGNVVAMACDPGLGDTRQREVQWCGNLKIGDEVTLYCNSNVNSTILYEYVANELRFEKVSVD